MTFVRSTMLLAALGLLAACHGASQKNDRRSASGEVLQGSVSDAMLPLDKVKSQGPTLAPSEDKKAPGGAADKAAGAAPDATSAASEAPSDQASPEPAASASSSPGRGGGSPEG